MPFSESPIDYDGVSREKFSEIWPSFGTTGGPASGITATSSFGTTGTSRLGSLHQHPMDRRSTMGWGRTRLTAGYVLLRCHPSYLYGAGRSVVDRNVFYLFIAQISKYIQPV